MEKEKKSPVSDVGAWGMNIVSSVGIIMANKQLMSPTGFAFGFGQFPLFLFLQLSSNSFSSAFVQIWSYMSCSILITLYGFVSMSLGLFSSVLNSFASAFM